MKKIILVLSVIAMLVTSCAEKEEFTIKGTLPSSEYDGKEVYLKVLGENWKDLVAIDTATVYNGSFEFKGLAQGGSLVHFVELAEPTDAVKRPLLLIVEPGQIEVSMDTVSTVKGTASNNSYQEFNDKLAAIDSEMKAIYKKAQEDTTKTAQAELEKQFEEKDAQKSALNYDFIKANAQSQLGAYLFASRSYMLSLDQMKEISALIKSEYKSNERMKKVEARIQALDATAEGKAFIDLKGKTPEGANASLADYAGKGKYVLVDFWASWCPPCRAEMPKLVEAYKLNKGKAFEIVGISLDKTNDDWVKGIKNLNISWPQISDLKFWDSELAAAYGVNSIPHLVLLDKDGKILARGLSADQAIEKLNDLLK